MIYVRDRKADSICDTWLAFLATKSSYLRSHWGGSDSGLLPLLLLPEAGAMIDYYSCRTLEDGVGDGTGFWSISGWSWS